jgi:hypothetical protein
MENHLDQAGTVASLRSDFLRAEARRDALRSQLGDIQREIQELEVEDEILDLVGGLFRTLIDAEVTDNVRAVEKLLTDGLEAIFEGMSFKVKADVDVQRGKVSVDLVTSQTQPDGVVTEGSAVDAYGGSVATVESALLRIIIILRRSLRLFVALDEPFGAVEGPYLPKVGRFLTLLCDRVGMDILTVTHSPVLVEEAKNSYDIRKSEGKAVLKRKR